MTREQHLEFCNRCLNRKFDATQGVICGLTNRIADFENSCENFKVDESVKIETPPAVPVPNYKVVTGLSDNAKALLRDQQDTVYAIVGGAAAALLGAVLWAVITVATHYQIGYMAIGVGLLVGFAVRFYGAGVDQHFGFIGAFFALLGCALGNLLSQVGFIAESESLGYFETITLLNLDVIINIYKEAFSPMDILFYGFAGYEGYKFAFRNISEELVTSAATGKLDPPPYSNLRLPTVGVLMLLFVAGAWFVMKGSVGVKTYFYESGNKRASGELVHGRENGPWQSWWENGNLQYEGFYAEGKQDSTWKFYNENGTLYRQMSFKKNLQHGIMKDLYDSGAVSAISKYVNGRLHGEYTAYYENGTLREKGFYYLDMPDGAWEYYYENGKISTKGSFNRAVPTGPWTAWNDKGVVTQELEYTTDGTLKVINSWNSKGEAEIVNGKGVFNYFSMDGVLQETGKVENGLRAGRWKRYYADRTLMEEGDYNKGVYQMVNAFTQEGNQIVKAGEGLYENISEDGLNTSSGLITKGLKSGLWKLVSPDSIVLAEFNFVNGIQDGANVNYFISGEKNSEGSFKNGKRVGLWTWYFESGNVESTVTFADGKKEGTQEFYDDNGDLLRTEMYKDGELVEMKAIE